MQDCKIDAQKIIQLDPIEWVDWVEKFKPLLPSYARIALNARVHMNTVTNVMRGQSENAEVKKVIVREIEKKLAELQAAASI